jgi:hypothetical protein
MESALAVQCPQCHAAVVPGMGTCQFCGTRVETVEPEAAGSLPAELSREVSVVEPLTPVPAQSVPAASVTAPDAPAPAAKPSLSAFSSSLDASVSKFARKRPLFFYLGTAAVCVLCGVMILSLILQMRSTFSISGNGAQSSGPDASESANFSSSSTSAGARELGIAVYPGARQVSGGEPETSADGVSVSATFVSGDEMAGVVDFYRTKMIGSTAIYASGTGMVVSIQPNAKESILVSISPATSGGKTSITITHKTAK